MTSDAEGSARKLAKGQSSATSDAILAAVLKSLNDDKAEDVVQIDLRGISQIGDDMVICSGRSTRQVAAISEKLKNRLKDDLGIFSKLEGKGTGDWVLVDTGDVIVHVFRPEVREFYQLDQIIIFRHDHQHLQLEIQVADQNQYLHVFLYCHKTDLNQNQE